MKKTFRITEQSEKSDEGIDHNEIYIQNETMYEKRKVRKTGGELFSRRKTQNSEYMRETYNSNLNYSNNAGFASFLSDHSANVFTRRDSATSLHHHAGS